MKIFRERALSLSKKRNFNVLITADGYGCTECRRIYEQVIHCLVAADNCSIESVSHNDQGDGYAQNGEKKERNDYLKQSR